MATNPESLGAEFLNLHELEEIYGNIRGSGGPHIDMTRAPLPPDGGRPGDVRTTPPADTGAGPGRHEDIEAAWQDEAPIISEEEDLNQTPIADIPDEEIPFEFLKDDTMKPVDASESQSAVTSGANTEISSALRRRFAAIGAITRISG